MLEVEIGKLRIQYWIKMMLQLRFFLKHLLLYRTIKKTMYEFSI